MSGGVEWLIAAELLREAVGSEKFFPFFVWHERPDEDTLESRKRYL